MGDLSAATDTISPLLAVLWVFYPMAALVLVELILRAQGRAAMMGFLVICGTYAFTGHIVPGIY